LTQEPFIQDVLPWLRLTLVPGVTPRVQRELLHAFGGPQAVLEAPVAQLAAVAEAAAVEALVRGPSPALVERTLRWLEASDHHLIALGDPRYPQALLTIADPPTVIHAVGRAELLNAPALAIVGSRNASAQGERDANAFATALSNAGLCIVSGMALGIDAAAHRGGLAGPGSSIAVMGTGADIVYPRKNLELARELATNGCLVSEFALGTEPAAGNFPRRNRLISGLARGVLVVEAGNPSGTLITARLALEQNRDVFAIPGSIHSPLSKGCHDLIKQGAKLVEEAGDILSELGLQPAAPSAPPEAQGEPSHPMLAAMGHAPASLDEIVQRTGMAAARVAAQLSRFEVEGRIALLPGGLFQRLTPRRADPRGQAGNAYRIE
jgi:DNA processing protein